MNASDLNDLITYLTAKNYPLGQSKEEKEAFRRKAKSFTVVSGALFYNGKGGSLLRVVFGDEKEVILKHAHENPFDWIFCKVTKMLLCEYCSHLVTDVNNVWPHIWKPWMRVFKWRIACYGAIKTEGVRNQSKFQNLRGAKNFVQECSYKFIIVGRNAFLISLTALIAPTRQCVSISFLRTYFEINWLL